MSINEAVLWPENMCDSTFLLKPCQFITLSHFSVSVMNVFFCRGGLRVCWLAGSFLQSIFSPNHCGSWVSAILSRSNLKV